MGWALGGKTKELAGRFRSLSHSSVLILRRLVGGAQRGGQQQRLNKALYQSCDAVRPWLQYFFNWGELVVSAELCVTSEAWFA